MVPAQIPVFLSKKPSTENGQFRVVALRLAWIPHATSAPWHAGTFQAALARMQACFQDPTRACCPAPLALSAFLPCCRSLNKCPDQGWPGPKLCQRHFYYYCTILFWRGVWCKTPPRGLHWPKHIGQKLDQRQKKWVREICIPLKHRSPTADAKEASVEVSSGSKNKLSALMPCLLGLSDAGDVGQCAAPTGH